MNRIIRTTRAGAIGALVLTASLVLSVGVAGVSTAGAAPAPIKVLTYGDYSIPPGVTLLNLGVQARVGYINAHGGIHGHKIQVISCDSHLSANILTTCLRQAVASGVVAVVGGSSIIDSVATPITTAAKLPGIGFQPTAPVGLNNHYNLCITPSAAGTVAGMADSLAQQGATKVATATPGGLGANGPANAAFAQAAKANKVTVVGNYNYPITTTDFSSTIATATSAGANGLGVLAAGPAATGALLQLVHTPGLKYAVLSTSITPPVLQSIKSVSSPIPAIDYVKPATAPVPGAKQFAADMKTYEPNGQIFTQTVASWAATNVFQQIADSIKGPITKASIYKAEFKLTNLSTGGFTPNVNATKHNQGNQGWCVSNAAVAVNVIKKGQIYPSSSGFLNPTTGKPVS